jgi:hypothetical protein
MPPPAPTSPSPNFNSAALPRLLGELGVGEGAAAKRDFAERLGEWLDFNDAIALYGALKAAGPAEADGPLAPRRRAAIALRAELAKVRAALTASVDAEASEHTGGKGRIKWPPSPTGDGDEARDFSPYQRYYAAHQRDMEAMIVPLRAKARALLAAGDAPTRKLAAIDAAFEKALSQRERHLLGNVPGLLEARWQAHLGDASPAAAAARLRVDLHAALRAELDLRLQAASGLIESAAAAFGAA